MSDEPELNLSFSIVVAFVAIISLKYGVIEKFVEILPITNIEFIRSSLYILFYLHPIAVLVLIVYRIITCFISKRN